MTTDAANTPQGLSSLIGEAERLANPHGAEGETPTAVNAEKNRSLYASRIKIYPKLVHGRYRLIKWIVMAVSLTIYYVTPWIRWDRGPLAPDQAVLLDFPHRRFYFFWIEIWPQEIYYLTGLLILASIALFLVTSVAGRVWCGYACPQTVWTDLFIYIERFFEGDRAARIRLDAKPFSLGKFSRKLAKHASWLVVAIVTGGAWVFYFDDAPRLAADLVTFSAPTVAYLFIGLFATTTYVFGGLAREQVCTYMCPWPRIQGAMFDDDSLLVTYKYDRGDPRGSHKKGTTWDGRGDCIDCGQCVAVCPMGIDIRDGMQMECIHCALCIDACDEIMDRVGRPRALIGYDTPANMDRRLAGEEEKINILRPRTIIYIALLFLVSGIMAFSLTTRSAIDLNILRDRNPLFVQLSDGSIRNGYMVKIINKLHMEQEFSVRIDGLDGAFLTQHGVEATGNFIATVAPDSLQNIKTFVILPHSATHNLEGGDADIRFTVENISTGELAINDTSFRGPSR
ncbi:MAG: cytochrome c oxidase accessory protein CcoG [Rhodobiaceae bacterium]|nr:MAG: cytochrome c oxidase accessory protein CcoG [Rhodobiaceae bacterium]